VEASNRAGDLMDLSLLSSNIEMHGNVWVNDNLRVFGDFMVVGSKDAVVPTENYGLRALSVIEMPETKFMDEGVAELINGLCRIDLDPIFLETIEPNTPETPFHRSPDALRLVNASSKRNRRYLFYCRRKRRAFWQIRMAVDSYKKRLCGRTNEKG
jgi:hypothetical protein